MSVSRLKTQHLPELNLLDLVRAVPEAHLLDPNPLIRAAVTTALAKAGHPPESLTFGEITVDGDDEAGFWFDVDAFYPDGRTRFSVTVTHYEMATIGHFVEQFEENATAAVDLLAGPGERAAAIFDTTGAEAEAELHLLDASDNVLWIKRVPSSMAGVLQAVRDELALRNRTPGA